MLFIQIKPKQPNIALNYVYLKIYLYDWYEVYLQTKQAEGDNANPCMKTVKMRNISHIMELENGTQTNYAKNNSNQV